MSGEGRPTRCNVWDPEDRVARADVRDGGEAASGTGLEDRYGRVREDAQDGRVRKAEKKRSPKKRKERKSKKEKMIREKARKGRMR